MFVLQMQINTFKFLSSHVDGYVSYNRSAWRYGAYLTTSEKGCEGPSRPSKIRLNSLFSFAKRGSEWLRTHRVPFDRCLQFVSSSLACAEKASLALSPPAPVLQPPLQVHC